VQGNHLKRLRPCPSCGLARNPVDLPAGSWLEWWALHKPRPRDTRSRWCGEFSFACLILMTAGSAHFTGPAVVSLFTSLCVLRPISRVLPTRCCLPELKSAWQTSRGRAMLRPRTERVLRRSPRRAVHPFAAVSTCAGA
jgi:hypothetical protein